MDSNPFTHLSDGELAGMFSAGNADDAREEAFRELLRRHAGMVLRVCRRITGNSQDGEDAAQMVFATLAGRAGELTASRSLAGWLYSTAWHVARRHRRSREAQRRRHQHYGPRLPAETFPEGSIDEDTLLEMYRAIEMLPPEYGQAIVLHHLQGMTIQEVSELMGCAPGTTAARLSRGRAMMRERLAWRGVMISLGGLEAALLAELKHELDEAELMHWIHHLPMDLDEIVATSNNLAAAEAGAAAVVATMFHEPSPQRALPVACAASNVATKWLCGVCVAMLLGVTTAAAAPFVFQTASSMFSMRVGGSATAETTSAGANAVESPSQSSGVATSVPEPGTGAIMLMGAALLGRRRRK